MTFSPPDPSRPRAKKSYLWHHARITNGPDYQAVRRMSNEAEMAQLSQDIFVQKFV